MSFDLRLFSGKLKTCRQELQLEPLEVAEGTGLALDRLIALESGLVEPSGDEVLIFADYFKQNYQYFITNQQSSASEQVKILYRKFDSEFTKADRWAVREFLYLCECEAFIFEEIGFDKISFDFTSSHPLHTVQGKEGAAALRKRLGLRPENLMPDPYSTLRKLGIHIFRRRLDNSKISGLFIDHPTAGRCVLVNYDEDIFRQNFTLAHEVGHAVFDYRDAINVSFGVSGEDKYKEYRANNFASGLLIPQEFLQRFPPGSWTDKTVLDAAKQLQVNIQPLAIAMKEAGIIDEGESQALQRRLKIPKADKIDPELKGLSDVYSKAKTDLLERGLSSFYVRKAYACYEEGHITAGRLANMLLCNESSLVQILASFNLKLSYGG